MCATSIDPHPNHHELSVCSQVYSLKCALGRDLKYDQPFGGVDPKIKSNFDKPNTKKGVSGRLLCKISSKAEGSPNATEGDITVLPYCHAYLILNATLPVPLQAPSPSRRVSMLFSLSSI